MSDNFQTFQRSLSSPAERHYAITPADGADVVPRPRALYVQAGGNLALRDAAGTVLAYAVTPGQVLPFRAARVMATGTTATVYGWE